MEHNIQLKDTLTYRPFHIYFVREALPEAKIREFNLVDPWQARKIIFCTEWGELAKSFDEHQPLSMSINAHHLTDSSLIETVSMVETLSKLVNCHDKLTLTLSIHKNTPHSLIKEAQKSRIMGIVPSCIDYPFEETLRALDAQWAGIPYWPDHIIKALPGAVAPKVENAAGQITLIPRQQQIFNIVTQRGCSNKHVAKIVGISESTVKLHLSHIFKKFGVKNRTQLTVFSKNNQTP